MSAFIPTLLVMAAGIAIENRGDLTTTKLGSSARIHAVTDDANSWVDVNNSAKIAITGGGFASGLYAATFGDNATEARESVKSVTEAAKSTARSVTEDVGDFASDATRRMGKQYGRARDVAAEAYDEMYDRAVENPYVALGLAVAIGFLLGAFLVGRR